MTTAFGADDLIKRSLFASIIGFGNKKSKCGSNLSNETNVNATPTKSNRSRSSHSAPYTHHTNPYRSLGVVLLNDEVTDGSVAHDYDNNAVSAVKSVLDNRSSDYNNFILNRSQQDIYREIVHECAELENKTAINNSSAQSLFASSSETSSLSTTPSSATSGVCSSDNDQEDADKIVQKSRRICVDHNQISPQPQTPSSSFETATTTTTTTILPSDYDSMNKLTIQEFVKLVVTEVKKSFLFAQNSVEDDSNETPEQILRRRRAQNNEAAARYRKRQREIREESENELKKLLRKNKELKQQIEQMQSEVIRLKCAVISMRTQDSNC